MRNLVLYRSMLPILVVVMMNSHPLSAQNSLVSSPTPDQDVVAPSCDRYGLSTLFRCTWHDVRHVANTKSMAWLVTGSALAAGSLLLDGEVSQSMMDVNPDQSLSAGQFLGEAGVHFGAATAIYVAARTTGSSDKAAFAVTLLRAQVVNGILTRSLKLLPRPRPFQEVATPTKGSFPSGHTSATFATATVISRRWGWRAGLPAYAVAGYVGAARLQNTHYLSDVAFGAALGIASGLAVTRSNTQLEVFPMIAPGIKGVLIDIPLGRSH